MEGFGERRPGPRPHINVGVHELHIEPILAQTLEVISVIRVADNASNQAHGLIGIDISTEKAHLRDLYSIFADMDWLSSVDRMGTVLPVRP